MRYLLGVCLLGRCEYERSAKEFLSVLERNPVYKKNVYLLLSIAFKKLDNISGAIRMVRMKDRAIPFHAMLTHVR